MRRNSPKEVKQGTKSKLLLTLTDARICPFTITTSHIEERLERHELTNQLHIPLTSIVVLSRKQETLCMLLDFDNDLTIDAPVDSRAYVSSIAQNEMDTIMQQAPVKIVKFDNPPSFQTQVAIGQLEKPWAATTPKLDIADSKVAEQFVILKKLTRPIIRLHFMRNNSVVIDATHCLILFQHLTIQVKTASSGASAKLQAVLTDNVLTIPAMATKTITAFVDYLSERNTLGSLPLLEKIMETANLLISHSMSNIVDNKVAIRVTNATELPYSIKKNTQIAEVSVFTQVESKFIKPVFMVIFSMYGSGGRCTSDSLPKRTSQNK